MVASADEKGLLKRTQAGDTDPTSSSTDAIEKQAQVQDSAGQLSQAAAIQQSKIT